MFLRSIFFDIPPNDLQNKWGNKNLYLESSTPIRTDILFMTVYSLAGWRLFRADSSDTGR